MDRYKVTQSPDQRSWVILDREWYDFCTLPNPEQPDKPIVLEWALKEGAEHWLKKCYGIWGRWERVAKHEKLPFMVTPHRWKPLPPSPNPFETEWYDR